MTSIHPSSGSSNMCLLQLMINVFSAKRNATTTVSTCSELNAEDEAVSSTISVPAVTRYTGKWRPRRVACHIRMIYGRGRGGEAAHSAPHSFPCMHYELCFQNRHTRIGDKMRSHHLQCRKQRRSSSSCFTSS